jgi:neogenin
VCYYDVGSAATIETELNVTATMCTLSDLRKFHQYSVRVVAFNANGMGTSTQEVNCRTHSDVPSAAPQNVSVDALSSTSIIVRWEPPPEDSLNGVVTGYKIRYRQGKLAHAVATVDGSQGQCTLTDLDRSTEYSIRVQAVNVNGTGPATAWISTETFVSDLDESTVPSEPTSLRVRPLTDSIVVSWTPPLNADHNVMIRGYILGYGVGVPDVYRQFLDAKQRYHTIRGLTSSSEYVISLKAFNNAGHGKPIYETTITREEKTPEPPTPITPPVGLKATVLSPTTIVLTWSDNALGRSQRVVDNRIYTVRYQPKGGSGIAGPALGRKQKLINSTSLNVHIEDLKPDTEYEFSVKIVKGHRQSAWSLSVFNKTYEMVPTTSVRDLTPVLIEGRPTSVSLNWQPPRQTNGQITGYQVFYTTDATLKDRDWVREDVPGDRLSVTIRGLSTETTYYFKVQARNNAGYGPMSPTVIFRTPRFDGSGGGLIEMPDDYGRTNAPRPSARDYGDGRLLSAGMTSAPAVGGISSTLLWIIISVIGGVTLIAVIIVAGIFCHRHCAKRRQAAAAAAHKNVSYMPANKGKATALELKPPDLWINYDHVNQRNLDQSEDIDEGTAMMSQSSHDERDPSDCDNVDRYRHMMHCPKPVMIPVDHPQLPMRDHVVYPRTGQLGSIALQPMQPFIGIPRINAAELLSSPQPTSGKEAAFNRPGMQCDYPRLHLDTSGQKPPPDLMPDSRVMNVIPATSDIERRGEQTVLTSPTTEKSLSPVERTPVPCLAPTFSTEELTAEMANLEGLMKDLSAIAQQQQEFDC